MGKLSRERENEIKRILPLVLLAVLVGADVAAACTSFAVFFDEPIFGMNFDCYPTEIRFGVVADDALDVKLFGMLVDYNGTSGISVLMTSSGLFGAMQQQRPASEGKAVKGPDEIFLSEVLAIRYIRAYENIEANHDRFDLDAALDTLKKTSRHHTLRSMVLPTQGKQRLHRPKPQLQNHLEALPRGAHCREVQGIRRVCYVGYPSGRSIRF